jgi:hypothetical protein
MRPARQKGAHASYQAETLHQHDSNWHAAGRVSELARGTVPCVDGHVSEIVTASERDRGTQHQLGGYMYVRCDVSMACGKVPPECTCILVVLSPTLQSVTPIKKTGRFLACRTFLTQNRPNGGDLLYGVS